MQGRDYSIGAWNLAGKEGGAAVMWVMDGEEVEVSSWYSLFGGQFGSAYQLLRCSYPLS